MSWKDSSSFIADSNAAIFIAAPRLAVYRVRDESQALWGGGGWGPKFGKYRGVRSFISFLHFPFFVLLLRVFVLLLLVVVVVAVIIIVLFCFVASLSDSTFLVVCSLGSRRLSAVSPTLRSISNPSPSSFTATRAVTTCRTRCGGHSGYPRTKGGRRWTGASEPR